MASFSNDMKNHQEGEKVMYFLVHLYVSCATSLTGERWKFSPWHTSFPSRERVFRQNNPKSKLCEHNYNCGSFDSFHL